MKGHLDKYVHMRSYSRVLMYNSIVPVFLLLQFDKLTVLFNDTTRPIFFHS